MPARREAEDTDPVRPDVPRPGLAAHEANGALSVEQRCRVAVRVHPVIEHEGVYSERVQPFRDRGPFMLRPEAISAAGADNHGSGRLRAVCREEVQRRSRFRRLPHR